MGVTLRGIRNGDRIRKARAWRDARGVPSAFHDDGAAGIAAETLAAWIAGHAWAARLNRAGTTFRRRPEAARAGLDAARHRLHAERHAALFPGRCARRLSHGAQAW